MNVQRFAIRIDRPWGPLLRVAFGVSAERAWVELVDGELVARFGWYGFRMRLDNIVGWRIEGPWRAITAIGVRRGLRSGEVSFSGTAAGGVRLEMRDRVHWTIFDVPVLYVGVEDLEGFSTALGAAGVPPLETNDTA